MKIELSDDDAAQVKAILETHAELADQHQIKSEELHGRMKRDNPKETEMIEDFEDQIKDFEEDNLNLKRIAKLFDPATVPV